ncbi:MAG: hypothetical protein Q9181_000901 [Wetmoreana brouardii]
MQRYRRALHNLLVARSGDKMGAVTWEISRKGGVHTHWQFLPVPAGLVKKGLVEAAFKVEAENEKYPTSFHTKDVGDGTGEKGADFFRVWIWMPSSDNSPMDGPVGGEDDDAEDKKGKEKCLVLNLNAEFRFDLQFGRRVMAKLLGLEGRMNWRDCAQSEEEEGADAEKFKEAFKRFDWALEE